MDRRTLLSGSLSLGASTFIPSKTFGQSPAASFGMGLKFLPPDDFARLPKDPKRAGSLPKSASVKDLAPAVGSQGVQGSCVGWSVGYGLAGLMLARRGAPLATSPAFIYNRGMLVDSVAGGAQPNCGLGMYIETALSYLQGFGILPLSQYPYDETSCSKLPALWEDQLARKRRVISDWATAEYIDAVKTSLATRLPALVGMQVRTSFTQHSGMSVFSAPASDPVIGGHAMLVVGYDDSKGAFEIMNSWGRQWGDQGFAWISYDTMLRDATQSGALRMYTVTI